MITQSGYMFCKYGGVGGLINGGLWVAPDMLAAYNGESSIGSAAGSAIGAYTGLKAGEGLYNKIVKPMPTPEINPNLKWYQKVAPYLKGKAKSFGHGLGRFAAGTAMLSAAAPMASAIGDYIAPRTLNFSHKIHPMDWAADKISAGINNFRGNNNA